MTGVNRQVEICVADVGGVAAARAGGADRIELCAALEVGGLTPSIGMIEHSLAHADGMFVTILMRVRPGHFVYDRDEIDVMCRDLATISLWAERNGWTEMGFTVGALTAEGQVDEHALARFHDAADNHPLVFHKAFDSTRSPRAALDVLATHGLEGVLTAGGSHGGCVDNLPTLRRLVEHAAAHGGPTVCAAGGVRAHNMRQVLTTGVHRVHLKATGPRPPLPGVAAGTYELPLEATDARTVHDVADLTTDGVA